MKKQITTNQRQKTQITKGIGRPNKSTLKMYQADNHGIKESNTRQIIELNYQEASPLAQLMIISILHCVETAYSSIPTTYIHQISSAHNITYI